MTKILATAGPASSSGPALRALIHAGVDAFRLNFSHGTADQHIETCGRIRSLSRSLGKPVAILQDLAGPKIRVGEMAEGEALLNPDSEVTITTRSVLGTSLRFSASYRNLPRDVKKGDSILLDDGLISLEVIRVKDSEVFCRVVKGGGLRSHKGMNLPNTNIRTPAVTAKDRRDLAKGMAVGMDYVALSFVRSPNDIHQLRRLLKKGGSKAWVIAKIERPEAVRRIDEILDAADGIMVARGDLGVEMQIEKVPILQKDLIRRANRADKLVITATQMLESMILHPVPTRAEVSDIANAIIDGTDSVMLSGETSVGQYPVRSVEIMVRIIQETENLLASSGPYPVWDHVNPGDPVLDTLGHATRRICTDLNPAAICTESKEGRTALFLSKSRPFIPIVTFSEHDETVRRLGLFWGIIPVRKGRVEGRERLFRVAVDLAKRKQLAHPGDYLVLVTGQPKKPRFLGSIDILSVPRNG